MNRVAIVVLNWNGIKDTLACLDSLVEQDYKDFIIVVVDNGSIDNSVKLLEEYGSRSNIPVHLIKNRKNKGFAGGVNTGIKYAMNQKFDYVALFNNDAVADKKWLSSLVNEMDNKKVGIATGLLLNKAGKLIDTTSEQVSIWSLGFPRDRDKSVHEAPAAELVFGATGGASLYRTKLFQDIGLFDEMFFAYYEDADISYRAQLAGWKVAYTPKAIAYHKKGATSNKLPGFTVQQTIRNLPLLFLKDTPHDLLLPVGARFYVAYWLIVGKAVVKGNAGPAAKGVLMSIPLGFRALAKRHRIQRHKRVSTDYIKSMLWNDLPPNQPGMRKLRKFFTGK